MTYLVEFVTSLIQRNNAGIFAYLGMNILMVMFFFSGGFSEPQGMLLGLFIYILSMAVALSPIGEWILRLQTGCRKITHPELKNRLLPLFNEVHRKAKTLNPNLPDDIQLFIADDAAPNAFATGRKTVCLTKGFLQFSDEEIKGVFAHELGHLSNKDTDLILTITVGNFIITGIFLFIRIIANVVGFMAVISSRSFMGNISAILSTVVANVVLVGLMWFWTKLGILLVMHSSRNNEFQADEFAHRCGYGASLVGALSNLGPQNATGLWANLASSHPHMDDRMERLQQINDASIRDEASIETHRFLCQCGQKLKPEAIFCKNCGAEAEGLQKQNVVETQSLDTTIQCDCGRLAEEGMKFCCGCGKNIEQLFHC